MTRKMTRRLVYCLTVITLLTSLAATSVKAQNAPKTDEGTKQEARARSVEFLNEAHRLAEMAEIEVAASAARLEMT